MTLTPTLIAPFNSGLKKDKKPFLLIDDAFQELTNAFAWRERIKKRDGIKFVGRLRRVFTSEVVGGVTISMGTTAVSLFTFLGVTEANPNLETGDKTTITLSFAAPLSQTWIDSTGTGVMTGNSGVITAVSINYATGVLTIESSAGVAASVLTASLTYFPSLPVMGICLREIAAINQESAIFFDQKYAYTHNGDDFVEMGSSVATTWTGSDSQFFWCANYRGVTPDVRLFFVTNFKVASTDPIRYHNGTTWTALTPLVSATDTLYQAKLIIPYYGRLLMFNTWEGTTAGLFAGAKNIFNRCRFSQIGDPTAADAWRSDQFGKGGFTDAPTNEAIVSTRFYKNTLIVSFERSTWVLQYVGEYGLPFVWERISSDLGSESTFSTVLFDSGVLAVGDKAIVGSSATDVQRIDLQIPDAVFNFHNENGGKERVYGIRDFQKEIVYWSYSDGGLRKTFPNRVLIYNYRNDTWAIFRDNVTAFGTFTSPTGLSWDTPTSWDDAISWDTIYQAEFPAIVCGNQEGYIHWYQYPSDMESTADASVSANENQSLYISGITRSATVNLQLTVYNHNLELGDIIYITDMKFVKTSDASIVTTSLNDSFYRIQNVVDDDTIDLGFWDFNTGNYESTRENNLGFTPTTNPDVATYMGAGEITLMPNLSIRTKDFNPYQGQGKQMMLSYLDLQVDATPNSSISIELYVNSSSAVAGNLLVGQQESEVTTSQIGIITGVTLVGTDPVLIKSVNNSLKTGDELTIKNVRGTTGLNLNTYTITFVSLNSFTLDGTDSSAFSTYTSGGNWYTTNPQFYYVPQSQYDWHRFYANVYGQYVTLYLTYDGNQMNTLDTHQQKFEMNAIQLFSRAAGRMILWASVAIHQAQIH